MSNTLSLPFPTFKLVIIIWATISLFLKNLSSHILLPLHPTDKQPILAPQKSQLANLKSRNKWAFLLLFLTAQARKSIEGKSLLTWKEWKSGAPAWILTAHHRQGSPFLIGPDPFSVPQMGPTPHNTVPLWTFLWIVLKQGTEKVFIVIFFLWFQ